MHQLTHTVRRSNWINILAEQISNDSHGIENMDAKYLAEDLIENESELFCD